MMSQVEQLFAAMNVNGGDSVTKFEFLEFLREHKPKYGTALCTQGCLTLGAHP